MKLIYFSPISWQQPAQRPHKFVHWFSSKYKAQVLWIDPYPTRLPRRNDLSRLVKYSYFKPKKEFNPNMPGWLKVICHFALPCEPLAGSELLNRLFWRKVLDMIHRIRLNDEVIIGIGKPSKLALEVLESHSEIASFYDAMDNFPEFYSGISQRSQNVTEKKILSKVTRLIVSSTGLEEHLVAYRDKMSVILNGFDPEIFPLKQKAEKKKRLVCGYLGTINFWFDWDFIIEFASNNPGLIVRLVGPIYHKAPCALPVNIQILPACCHELSYRCVSEFDMGLIPFKKTKLTACVDPIKYYEYRSLGIPVVSTKFGEMIHREHEDGVFLVDDAVDLQQKLSAVFAYQSNLEAINDFRKRFAWDVRFDSFPLNKMFPN